MGNKNSRMVKGSLQMSPLDMRVMTLMFPVWYTSEPLTEEDVVKASSVWTIIVRNESEEFARRVGTPGFEHASAVSWFFNTFYDRLFDVYPSVRPLFKRGLVVQGRFLVRMISLLLGSLKNESELDSTLHTLVLSHNAKGIKANEYGMVGEIIFYSLRKCTGAAYTSAVGIAWMKVFSRMLSFIVPKAIAMEIETESFHQQQRFADFYSISDEERKADQSKKLTGATSRVTRERKGEEVSAEDDCPFLNLQDLDKEQIAGMNDDDDRSMDDEQSISRYAEIVTTKRAGRDNPHNM